MSRDGKSLKCSVQLASASGACMAEFTLVVKDRVEHAFESEAAWTEYIKAWLASQGEAAKVVYSKHTNAIGVKTGYGYCKRHCPCSKVWQFNLEQDLGSLWFLVYIKGEHGDQHRTRSCFLTAAPMPCVPTTGHEWPLRSMATAAAWGTPASVLPPVQGSDSARNKSTAADYMAKLPGPDANLKDLDAFDWIRLEATAAAGFPDGMGVFTMPVMFDMVQSMAFAKSLAVQVYDCCNQLDKSDGVLLVRCVAQPLFDPQTGLLRNHAIPIAFARAPQESKATYVAFVEATDAWYKSLGCDLSKVTKFEFFDGSSAKELALKQVHPDAKYGHDVRLHQVVFLFILRFCRPLWVCGAIVPLPFGPWLKTAPGQHMHSAELCG